jgi:hypothetical protein
VKIRSVLGRLNARLADARQLIDIHTTLTGNARGRRYDVDALNRGAVILSIAGWEAFVQDLALQNAGYFALGLPGAGHLPDEPREAFLVWLHGTTDFKNPTPAARQAMWSITGQGWRRKFREFAKEKVDSFSTPSPNNVGKLFRTLLGIDDITDAWGYRRWGPDIYREKLDQTLLLRHRIAHGAIGSETVGKTRAREAISLVSSLGQRSSDEIKEHFKQFKLNVRRRRSRQR